MAAPLTAGSTGQQPKPLFERFVKIFIVLAAGLILYTVASDLMGDVFSSARQSHVDGDLKTIGDAIRRRTLAGKRFEDWDVSKLQGEFLESVPKDPHGQAYLYDWFFERLVCLGPDQHLQTLVPGKSYTLPTAELPSDDQILAVKGIDRLLFGLKDGTGSQLIEAAADGSEQKVLYTSPLPIVGISPTADAKGNTVLATVTTPGGARIAVVDLKQEPATQTVISPDTEADSWAAPYGGDHVFVQSSRAGGTAIAKVSMRDKTRLYVTSADGREPSIDAKERFIWYSAKVGDDEALYRMPFAGNAEVALHQPGQRLRSPAVSGSGIFLAYLVAKGAGPTGTLEVVHRASKKTLVTRADVLLEGGIVWSPDSTKVGFLVNEGGTPRIVVLHVERNVSATLPLSVTPGRFAWLTR